MGLASERVECRGVGLCSQQSTVSLVTYGTQGIGRDRPLRIGIDAMVLRGRDAGTLRYVEQLLSGLADADRMREYIVFANASVLPANLVPAQPNVSCRDVPAVRILPRAVQQQFYRSWNSQGPLDLLHCPAFVPPLFFGGRIVATVFDLTFWLYPQTMKWTGRLWWRLFGRKGIERADRVIALSESTKRDLGSCLGIPPERVRVIYPCTRGSFKPDPNGQQIAAKYGLPEKYILYTGTLESRKNIANVVRAYGHARRIGSLKHVLVLAGRRGWLYADVLRTIADLGLESQVVILGYIPEKDLPGLYSAADLFVYLSRYEGFGLPVLEAMACGVPVLASNSSAIPEVVGQAGILVAPDDWEQAAFQMSRILQDRSLHAAMVQRGFQQASQFTAERLVRETCAVYDELSATA